MTFREEQDISRRHLVRLLAFFERELDEIPASHPLHDEMAQRVQSIRTRLPLGVVA